MHFRIAISHKYKDVDNEPHHNKLIELHGLYYYSFPHLFDDSSHTHKSTFK